MEKEEHKIEESPEKTENLENLKENDTINSGETQNDNKYSQAVQAYLDANVGVREKKPSSFVTFFKNLKYRLSYTPALVYTSVFSFICLFGLLFFINQRNIFIKDPEVVTSCLLMIIVFAVFLALFVVLLIISIVLNIIRYRQGKK